MAGETGGRMWQGIERDGGETGGRGGQGIVRDGR